MTVKHRSLWSRVFLCLLAIGMTLTLTACNQQNTEEVTKAVTEFVTACGNEDFGIAIQYISPEAEEEGLVWMKIPNAIKEKMADNTTADVEVRKYIGHGLKLTFGNAEVQEVKLEDNNTAVVILIGNGKMLHWDSVDNISEKISSATESEFINDYQWYKEKILDKSQDIVFSDIRNKVTPKVFTELKKGLDQQPSFDYAKQVYMKKEADGSWKITKIITNKDDGTSSNWFGDDTKK